MYSGDWNLFWKRTFFWKRIWGQKMFLLSYVRTAMEFQGCFLHGY